MLLGSDLAAVLTSATMPMPTTTATSASALGSRASISGRGHRSSRGNISLREGSGTRNGSIWHGSRRRSERDNGIASSKNNNRDIVRCLSPLSQFGVGNDGIVGTIGSTVGNCAAEGMRHHLVHCGECQCQQGSPIRKSSGGGIFTSTAAAADHIVIRRPTGCCRHFHYDTMELGPVRVELVEKNGEEKQDTGGNQQKQQKSDDDPDEDNAPALVLPETERLHFQVHSNGKKWTVTRTVAELHEFDRQLHRCVFSREHSRLEELSIGTAVVVDSKDWRGEEEKSSAEATTENNNVPRHRSDLERIHAYLRRLSLLTGSLFRCYPVLSFFELDNRGNHFPPVEYTEINRPAIACAVAVRPFRAYRADHLPLQVGDIISIVEMRTGADWWRGKLTVPSGRISRCRRENNDDDGTAGNGTECGGEEEGKKKKKKTTKFHRWHAKGQKKHAQSGDGEKSAKNAEKKEAAKNAEEDGDADEQRLLLIGGNQQSGEDDEKVSSDSSETADDEQESAAAERRRRRRSCRCKIGLFPANCVRLFTERLSVGEQIWLLSRQLQQQKNGKNPSVALSARRFAAGLPPAHFVPSLLSKRRFTATSVPSSVRKLFRFSFSSSSASFDIAGTGPIGSIGAPKNGSSSSSRLKSLIHRLSLPSSSKNAHRHAFLLSANSSSGGHISTSSSSASPQSPALALAAKNANNANNQIASANSVFGRKLCKFGAENVPPPLVTQCLALIEQEGMVPGIYRQCGVQSNIQRLRQTFDNTLRPNWEQQPELAALLRNDIHSVPSLLKQFFRQLPDPLLSYQIHPQLISLFTANNSNNGGDGRHTEEEEFIARLRALLSSKLHPAHFRTARSLFTHLQRIARHPQTEMNARNLAIVWAPNLLRCPAARQDDIWPNQLVGLDLHTDICAFLIANADRLFCRRKCRPSGGQQQQPADAKNVAEGNGTDPDDDGTDQAREAAANHCENAAAVDGRRVGEVENVKEEENKQNLALADIGIGKDMENGEEEAAAGSNNSSDGNNSSVDNNLSAGSNLGKNDANANEEMAHDEKYQQQEEAEEAMPVPTAEQKRRRHSGHRRLLLLSPLLRHVRWMRNGIQKQFRPDAIASTFSMAQPPSSPLPVNAVRDESETTMMAAPILHVANKNGTNSSNKMDESAIPFVDADSHSANGTLTAPTAVAALAPKPNATAESLAPLPALCRNLGNGKERKLALDFDGTGAEEPWESGTGSGPDCDGDLCHDFDEDQICSSDEWKARRAEKAAARNGTNCANDDGAHSNGIGTHFCGANIPNDGIGTHYGGANGNYCANDDVANGNGIGTHFCGANSDGIGTHYGGANSDGIGTHYDTLDALSGSSSYCCLSSASSMESVPLDVSRYDNVQQSNLLMVLQNGGAKNSNNKQNRGKKTGSSSGKKNKNVPKI